MAMNQKTRSLVGLAALSAVAAGLLLYAYYGIHKGEEKAEERKAKEELLFSFDRAQVASLTVSAKGETTVLAPGQGGWQIVSPLKAAADPEAIDALIDRVLSLRRKSIIEPNPADLAKFGLLRPSVKITARMQDGSEHSLRVGLENQFDGSAYVLAGDSTDVLQVESGVRSALEKNTLDLREKRIVPFDPTAARGLDVKMGDQHYILRKDDRWKLSSPISDRADEQAATRLLGTLASLHAIRFATDLANPVEDERYGLASPRLEAIVTLGDGKAVSLEMGEAEVDGTKKLFARRSDATFIAEVPGSILDQLTVDTFSLRDKSVLEFDREQVGALRFMAPDGTATVERVKATDGGADDWRIASSAPSPVKRWKMSGILWALGTLKASAFVDTAGADLEAYGLDKPGRSVTLSATDGHELATLLVGKEEGEKVYVKNTASSRVFEVEKARLGDLPSSVAELEDKPAPDAGTAG